MAENIDVHPEDDALLVFAEETPALERAEAYWKVLIVDDEPEVHKVTKVVLRDFLFQGLHLDFISAYSASDAREVLQQEPDIALILLDVVMETEDAGLQLVHHIRDELHNKRVRIILRTGQPGHAPEQQVVQEYDINDYRSKTELTAHHLLTTVISSLRAYTVIRDLDTLNSRLESEVEARTRELQLAHDKLKSSLQALEEGERAGKRVQFKLLPERHKQFGEYHFSHRLKPSEFMSGDFLDYFRIDDDRVGFYIADVSGHGVASAFVTVYLKRFMGTSLYGFQCKQHERITDPAALLSELNQELLREQMSKYIAIFYGVLNIRDHTLRYANAGAYPWPLYFDEHNREEYIELKSTPVGMFDFSVYQNHSRPLPPSCRLLMFSDGVLDLLPGANNDDKLRRLTSSICTPERSVDEIIEKLSIPEDQALPDDLTLLKIERRSD
ncbi:PP2C family protein-serine/threonine phosphatase [Nitrincola alkalilacustris]|uniref:PP2C family protein-serine/threonine phosphatase n=1 Tax=Nitrincola alkalilacustris TaxID=1571224 RepID=UPI00124E42CD|nr:SpoIIE family protein phosphatase [Nitrincola alkalilacustris]